MVRSFEDIVNEHNLTSSVKSFEEIISEATVEEPIKLSLPPTIPEPTDIDVQRVVEKRIATENIVKAETGKAEQIVKTAGKMAVLPIWSWWKTLGFFATRIEYPLATIASKVAQARIAPLQILLRPPGSVKEVTEELGHLTEIPHVLKESLKTWIPGHDIPDEVRDFTGFYATYYDTIAGPGLGETPEKTPLYAAEIPGLAGSMLSPLPGLKYMAKATRFTGALVKRLVGVADRIPLWDALKISHSGEKMARLSEVAKTAEEITPKHLGELAKDINQRLGTNITAKTVGIRLSQLAGRTGQAGITTVPKLERTANSVIGELESNSRELLKLGMRPTEVYTTKLTKLEESALQTQKTALRDKISKLSEAPYKEQLLKKITAIDLPKGSRERISNHLLKLGMAIEDGGLALSEKLSSILELPAGTNSQLFNALSRIEKADRKTRLKEVSNLLDIASTIEGLPLKGVIPAVRYVLNMKRNFPGKADQIRLYLGQIDEINKRLYKSEIFGGAPYFPHVIEEKPPTLLKNIFQAAKKKISPQKYLKRRELIKPEEVRAAGTMESISYPATKRLVQVTNDIYAAKLFKEVSLNPEWVGDAAKPGFVKMAKDEHWGALSGKFVTKRIYDDLNMTYGKQSDLGKTYDALLGIFKSWKVSLSPAVQIHNLGGNIIQLYASGMNTQDIAFAANLVKLAHKINSREWQNVKKYIWGNTALMEDVFGQILGTFSKGEKGFVGLIQKATELNKAALKYPSMVWGHNEKLFKTIKYFDSRSKGMTEIQAVQEANKWLIDYGDLLPVEKQVFRRIMPFYTFTSRSVPLMIEAIAKHPTFALPFVTLPHAMTKFALNRLDVTEQDFANIQKELPSYMQNGNYMLMPYRDVNGNLRLWDWTSFLPWNVFDDMQDRGALSPVLSNPLVQISWDIHFNLNSYTQQPIVPSLDLEMGKYNPEIKQRNTIRQMAYLWNILAPRIASTNFWSKMIDAATGKTKHGKITPIPETFAQEIAGIRLVPVDVELNRRMKQVQNNDIRNQTIKKLRSVVRQFNDGDITEEEFDKESALYRDTFLQIQEQ